MKVYPIAYFPSIRYFESIAKESHVMLEMKEHFPKQTYRNRCDVLGANGILSLSIPVKRPNGNKSSTDSIILSDDENWRSRHWRTIVSAYQSAPFFDYYGIEVEALIFQEETNLANFNLKIIERICSLLDIQTTFEFTTEFHTPIDQDPRDVLVGKKHVAPIEKAPYIQVFPEDKNFHRNLSILDAIMCEGPLARKLLLKG